MRVGFIGTGAVGTTLARALDGAGVPVVAVASRSFDAASRLAGELRDCTAWTDPQAVVNGSDLIFLTVPDDSIDEVCRGLCWSEGKAAVHCSGARTITELSSAAKGGAQTGSCHPMQTFAGSGETADHIRGCMFGVEAEGPLRAVLGDLVERIGGWSLFLRGEDKSTYHLAGVIASNYLVVLAATASGLLQHLDLTGEDAVRGLLPLMRGTVDNLHSRDVSAALTGPISRGDAGTVNLHLATLAARYPEVLAIYIEMGKKAISIASADGSLNADEVALLTALLDDYEVT